MVVDDAAFIREALIQICKESGHLVVGEASDGVEAVAKALSLRPDVIIMDMVMPLKNGVEAVTEILEKMPKMKIIACSTVDQEFLKDRALKAGCLGFVSKPFKKIEIIEALSLVRQLQPAI